MVLADIEREDVALYVEQQQTNNKLYSICRVCTFKTGISNPAYRISVSSYDRNKELLKYQEMHGIDIVDGKFNSFYLCREKGHVINLNEKEEIYTDDGFEYYKEIKDEFNDLINSESCEFTDKALSIFDEIFTIGEEVWNIK